MMPKMDGIEATKIIREMGYDHPIVALTANAVIGQADLFLENGFDDFISKPIDIRQLNLALNRLIRDKYQKDGVPDGDEPLWEDEADDDTGIFDDDFESGMPSKEIVEVFRRDAEKSLVVINDIITSEDGIDEDTLRTYTIHVHGLKSALANIGNKELSATAYKLEQSARDKIIEFVISETPQFLKALRVFVDGLKVDDDSTMDQADEDMAYLWDKLLVIKTACEEYNEGSAEVALGELKTKGWSQPTKELLSAISEHLLHSDFSDVTDVIDKFLKGS
jgi:CheY-like chemotaxis protein